MKYSLAHILSDKSGKKSQELFGLVVTCCWCAGAADFSLFLHFEEDDLTDLT